MRLSCGMAVSLGQLRFSKLSILIHFDPPKIQTTCPTCCLVTCGCSILGQASAIVQVPMPHKAIQQPAVSWLVTTNNEHLDLSANGVYLQYSHFHGGFGGNPTRTPLEGEGGGVPLFFAWKPWNGDPTPQMEL